MKATAALTELKQTLINRTRLKVIGELEVVTDLKDGATLLADNYNGKRVNYFKVTKHEFKVGRFQNGKFRYGQNNIIPMRYVSDCIKLIQQHTALSAISHR